MAAHNCCHAIALLLLLLLLLLLVVVLVSQHARCRMCRRRP